MKNPTHFIEIYSVNIGKSGKTSQTAPIKIKRLEKHLKDTNELGLKTIAIFKIKMK